MDKLKKALSGDDDEEQGIVTQVCFARKNFNSMGGVTVTKLWVG